MHRVVLRVRESAVEDVLDELLPRLADGVHERPPSGGEVELVAHALTGPLPERRELEALAGAALVALDEREVPDDWRERRRHDGAGGVAIAGRVWLRSPLDPPAAGGLLDLVVESGGAFGTGAHPTTRMCLALLAGLEPRGGFADLGCGAGALAIAAAMLGFSTVSAVDVSDAGVAAARANARRNGVAVDARTADLITDPPPAARVAAANVPVEVHDAMAARLAGEVEVLLASGFRPGLRDAVRDLYAARGFALREECTEDGWTALRLERAGA